MAIRLLLSLLVLVIAGCGANTVVTKSAPQLGPPSGEAAQSQPVQHSGAEHATYHGAAGCGTERWAVKTGTDPAVEQVQLRPQDSTIADLGSIQPPVDPTDRLAPTETTVFHIQATVAAIKQENDSDYHLALTDGQGHTMIAESPSTGCDAGSAFSSQIAQVRRAIDQACLGISSVYRDVDIPADLTGVGFFDRIHGQRGVAPNGIELHPLLAVTLHGRC